ncbi:hypothetical protein C7293_24855 [filamentous cyanobacterium CCT1]|nr:hypothetical protein C7293_24855 [filamentous cyanobacterium CCT1]PSN81338.1 hypothetical protein C8B47_01945 [filamentous cyanobacterium CCP4]
MIEPEQLPFLIDEIDQASSEEISRLKELRQEITRLGKARHIRDFSATAISLVASDGGNNRLQFDPFEVQIIRVVDSYGQEACLKVVSRYKNIATLSREQVDEDGNPLSPLGELMIDLGVSTLSELSPMLRPRKDKETGKETLNPSWVLVYRDLWEWAILYDKFKKGYFATNTLIVIDGLLRSKVFSGDLFIQMIKKIQEYIKTIKAKQRRDVYLVGVAKRSKVLDRYRLAMMLEGIMREPRPVFVRVPQEIEELSYDWPEYTRRPEDDVEGKEKAKFVGGYLFLAKFGSRPGDHIWPVDILLGQQDNAEKILAYLKSDAEEGFPIPYYPNCIQRAHEHSALTGIDMEILQLEIIKSLLGNMPTSADVESFEEFILNPKDPAGARYE